MRKNKDAEYQLDQGRSYLIYRVESSYTQASVYWREQVLKCSTTPLKGGHDQRLHMVMGQSTGAPAQ